MLFRKADILIFIYAIARYLAGTLSFSFNLIGTYVDWHGQVVARECLHLAFCIITSCVTFVLLVSEHLALANEFISEDRAGAVTVLRTR